MNQTSVLDIILLVHQTGLCRLHYQIIGHPNVAHRKSKRLLRDITKSKLMSEPWSSQTKVQEIAGRNCAPQHYSGNTQPRHLSQRAINAILSDRCLPTTFCNYSPLPTEVIERRNCPRQSGTGLSQAVSHMKPAGKRDRRYPKQSTRSQSTHTAHGSQTDALQLSCDHDIGQQIHTFVNESEHCPPSGRGYLTYHLSQTT